MNPNRQEEEIDEVAWQRAKARRKKQKLQVARQAEIKRQDICKIIDEYNFNALHARIMKEIDKISK